jgi:hypothetical protein
MAVGLISTANLPTDLARKSFSAMITRLMPNGSAPLFALTALLKDETALNIEHGYFTKTMIFPVGVLNGAIADGVTTLFTVVSTADLVIGDLLRADTTGEVVLVTSVPSTTQLVVQRGVGTVAAAAIADTVSLYSIGNAFEEGSIRPQSVAIIAVRYVNYTQIFRNSWAVSKTLAAMPMIAGDGMVAESRSDCASLHALAIEKSLFFGQKYIGTRNGQPFHTQEGIVARITATAPTQIVTLGATTNWTQFEAALDPTLQTVTDPKSGNIRTMFVGGVAQRVITNIARLNSTYMIETTTTSWGLQINTVRTPRGVFEMIAHPLFNAYGNTSTWAKMAVVVDLNAFSIAYLRRTSNVEYNEDGARVDNGIDAQGGTLTTELTNLIKNPFAFSVIYGFTAAAAG